MLFLGSLDDKTIEYPNGFFRDEQPLASERILLNHLLFSNEPLVLEEGFILASEEAINPDEKKPFLLPAIQSGHIKVVSRYHDMPRYVSERRAFRHAAPPDTVTGRSYVDALQKACCSPCGAEHAFLDYPPSAIDEVTFNRFVNLCSQDKIYEYFDMMGADFPRNFLPEFESTYEKGNDGKHWTARAAWEHTAKMLLGGKPEFIHLLMIIANRE